MDAAPPSLQAGLFRQELCITLRVVLQEVLDDFVHQVLNQAREMHPGDPNLIQKTFECGVRSVTIWDTQMRDQIRAQTVTKYRSVADLYQHCYLTFIEEMYGDTLANVSVRVMVPALSIMLHTFFKTACTDRAMISGEYVTTMTHMGRVLFIETAIRRTMYELLIQHQNIKQMASEAVTAAPAPPSLAPAPNLAPALKVSSRRPSLSLTMQPESAAVSHELPIATPIVAAPAAPTAPAPTVAAAAPPVTKPAPSPAPSPAPASLTAFPVATALQTASIPAPPQPSPSVHSRTTPSPATATSNPPPTPTLTPSLNPPADNARPSASTQPTAAVRNYTSIPSEPQMSVAPAAPPAAAPVAQPRRPSPYSAHNPAGVERAPSLTALSAAANMDSLDLCPSNEMFNDEIHRILGSAITDANDTFDSVSRLAAGGASRPPALA
jgi:hypothetical protein